VSARVAAPALALVAGCATFPASLVVPSDALDELARRPTTVEALDEREVARGVRAVVGDAAPPLPLASRRVHRVDRAPVGRGFLPREARGADSVWTRDLATGDLLLAKTPGARSLGSSLALAEATYYDHVGVAVVEGGRVRVYESWPELVLVGPSPSFAARFRGGARRGPLSAFLARYEVVEVVRVLGEGRRAELGRAARASLDEGIVFDPYHDPDRPELSCSEYALHLLERAGWEPAAAADGPELCAPTANASVGRVMRALGFGSRGYLAPDAFARVPGARRVALFSRHATRAETFALRDAHLHLWRRLGDGGRVADLLAPHPWRLMRYRANVRRFLEQVKGVFRRRPDAGAEERRRVVAALEPVFFRER